MSLAAILSLLHRVGDELGLHGHALTVDVDLGDLGRHDLAGAHGASQEVGHPSGPLERRDVGSVVDRRLDTRIQPAQAGQDHPRLAERRQHLLDVPQEGARRPDDEDTGAAEALAVRVEQVGGAVQSDGGLARARAALHHQDAVELGADDPVLLGLDRGDDVGHAAGALSGERRHQSALALKLSVAPVEQRRVEHLVFDAGDGASVERQMTSRAGPHRGRGGGLVERAGSGNPPVEQDRMVVGIAQTDAPDVAVGAGRRVRPVDQGARGRRLVGLLELQPTERQAIVDLGQLREGVFVESGVRVALAAALMIAADRLAPDLDQPLPRFAFQRVEALVECRNVVTFAIEFRWQQAGTPRERQHTILITPGRAETASAHR
ncbi:hypothetical protein GCM10025867_23720 [Frondihabitans sucicola]|uniref:A-factor biosynthesis hotdog domain-containing protein n=1 Tax=Frondihabitans sucicola TaxID=1268041 RepID=A0ABM8GNW1_9MICO|nr:hypothetical protein GCM10025867_23720 [Frondihabitans sucicola]